MLKFAVLGFLACLSWLNLYCFLAKATSMKTNVHVQTRFFWRIGGFLNWVYPWIIHLWYLSCVETCSIFFDMCLYFVHQFPYLVPKKNIFYVLSPLFPKNVHVFCPWISIKNRYLSVRFVRFVAEIPTAAPSSASASAQRRAAPASTMVSSPRTCGNERTGALRKLCFGGALEQWLIEIVFGWFMVGRRKRYGFWDLR